MATIIGLVTWDYIVICVLVIFSFLIGIYQAYKVRNSKNTNDFLIRASDVGLLPITFSAIASQVSATGILGNSAEVYKYGIVYMFLALAALVIIPIGTHLYLPVIYKVKSNSIFKYLEYRFDGNVRYGAAIIDTCCKLFITSVCAYAPAVALNQVTGLHIWASLSIVGVTCIIYTSLGGIKAVIWTDVVQLGIMMAALSFIMIKSVMDVGGLSEIWKICADSGRTNFFPDSDSFYTPWTTFMGCSFHFLSLLITNNMFTQRYLARPNLKQVQLAYTGTCCGFSIVITFTSLIGLFMYATFHDCDPLLNGDVVSRDQTAAFFAMKTLSFLPGLSGMFVAGILCATLSTFSSLLNAMVVVIIEDFVRPKYPTILERDVLRLSKVLITVFGIVSLGLVVVVEFIPGIMQAAFSFNGMFMGPLFAVFTAGMLLPWVNSKGVIAGYVTACAFIAWPIIGIMINKPYIATLPFSVAGCNNSDSLFESTASLVPSNITTEEKPFLLYSFSPLMYFFWSFIIVLVIGLIVSFTSGSNNPENIDPKLLFSFVPKIIFKCPSRLRTLLGFTMDENKYFQKWNQSKEIEMKSVKENCSQLPLKLSDELQQNGY